jgi:DNA processing protein
LITFWDAEYPENLKKIYDPPVLLFIRGTLTPADKNAIALVGTRTPTAYGRGCVESFSKELVQQQITVVSGMARGIDTYAHWAAINAGGRTIAVLGSGVDVVYPPENKNLMPKMIEQGAIISEFLMGAKPDAPNFPRRNRIVSGISLGVVVIEAGKKSGALITANIALDQNREVFAIPGNINSPHSIGTNALIQEGAKLVTGAGDVIDELKPQLSHLLATAKIKRKQISLTAVEQTIWENLSTEAMHIDQIASINQLSVAQALGVLLALELKDMVIQMPGKYFIKSI